jgi:hypothetical protein
MRLDGHTDLLCSFLCGCVWIEQFLDGFDKGAASVYQILMEMQGIIRQVFMEESSPRLKKARHMKSRVNLMLIIFFDIKGIVHKECLSRPDSQFCILLYFSTVTA